MHNVSSVLNSSIRFAQTTYAWTVTAAKVTSVALPTLFLAYQLIKAAKNYYFPPHRGALVSLTLPPVAEDPSPISPPTTPMRAGAPTQPVIRPLSPRDFRSPRVCSPMKKRELPPSQLKSKVVLSPGASTSDPSSPKKPASVNRPPLPSPFSARVALLSVASSPTIDNPTPFQEDEFLRTPQPSTPAFIFKITYPTSPIPASPKASDGPSYLPNLIRWIGQLMKRPVYLKDRPFKMECDNEPVIVTEEVLARLEDFFKDYQSSQTFNDGNPYLLCHLLEKHTKKQLFLTIHPDDRARIEALLLNYQAAQALDPSDPNFYLDYPMTNVRASEIKAAVDDFLTTENKIEWFIQNHSTDIFYWCYMLEKNKVSHDVLASYNKAREIIFENPALSQFFYIDPFEITLNNEKIVVDAEQLLEMRDLIHTVEKTGIRHLGDTTSFEYFNSILEIFSANRDVFFERPEFEQTLILDLINSFANHKRILDRVRQKESFSTAPALSALSSLPLPQNYNKTLTEIANLFDMISYRNFLARQRALTSDKTTECYSFQELAIEHRKHEDVVKELQEVQTFFNELSSIPDDKVAQWLADTTMSPAYIQMLPFYKAFLLSFPYNNYDNIPEEGKGYISSIIRKYIRCYSRLKNILGEGVEVNLPNSKTTKIYLTDLFQEGLSDFVKSQ